MSCKTSPLATPRPSFSKGGRSTAEPVEIIEPTTWLLKQNRICLLTLGSALTEESENGEENLDLFIPPFEKGRLGGIS